MDRPGGIDLHHTTGDEKVDEILRGTIGLFEAVVPGRIAGYYLAGSYADGTAVSTSDIDLFYDLRVSREDLTAEEARRCLAVVASVDQISSIEILPALVHAPMDVLVIREGAHLYGDDRRAQMPAPSAGEVLRWLLRRPPRQGLRRRGGDAPAAIRYPLDYPDPSDEFFGYLRRDVRTRDGRVHEGTHGLVNLITGAATTRMAIEKGVLVPRKGACPAAYCEHVGDEWAGLIGDAYEWCRNRWEYLVPEHETDRWRLRALCRRTLALENHDLLVRREYLSRLEAGDDDADRAFAAEALALIAFPT